MKIKTSIINFSVFALILLQIFKHSNIFMLYEFLQYLIYVLYLAIFILVFLEAKKKYKELIVISLIIVLEVMLYFQMTSSYITIRWLNYIVLFSLILLLYFGGSSKNKEVNETPFLKIMAFISGFSFFFIWVYSSANFYYIQGSNTSIFYEIIRLANRYRGLSYENWDLIMFASLSVLTLLLLVSIFRIKTKSLFFTLDNLRKAWLSLIVLIYVVYGYIFITTIKRISTNQGENFEQGFLFPLITTWILLGLIFLAVFDFKKYKNNIIRAFPYLISIVFIVIFYFVYIYSDNLRSDGKLSMYIMGGSYIASIVLFIVFIYIKRTEKSFFTLDYSKKLLLSLIVFSYVIFGYIFLSITNLIFEYQGECYKVSFFLSLVTTMLFLGIISLTIFHFKENRKEVIRAIPYIINIILIAIFYLVYVYSYNHLFDGLLSMYVLGGSYIVSIVILLVLKIKYSHFRIDVTTVLSLIYLSIMYYALINMIDSGYYMVCT